MLFLLLGLLLLALKLLEVAPVSVWSWFWVLSPFGLAVLWWFWADHSGYTKRKAFEQDEKRKTDRINRQRKEMGLPPSRH